MGRLSQILESVAQYEPHNFVGFFFPLRDFVEEFLVNELKRGRLDINARPVVDIVSDIKAHLAMFPATQIIAQQDIVFYTEFAVGRAESAQNARDTEMTFLTYIVDKNHLQDTLYFKTFGGLKPTADWRRMMKKSKVFRPVSPVTLDALNTPPCEDDPSEFDTIDDFFGLVNSLSSDESTRPDGLVCTPDNFAMFPPSVRS